MSYLLPFGGQYWQISVLPEKQILEMVVLCLFAILATEFGIASTGNCVFITICFLNT